jgi:hypothetical protein
MLSPKRQNKFPGDAKISVFLNLHFGLSLNFWLGRLHLIYSYIGCSENMLLNLLVAVYLFQAHMSVHLSREADSVQDSNKHCTTEMLFRLQTYRRGQEAHKNSYN